MTKPKQEVLTRNWKKLAKFLSLTTLIPSIMVLPAASGNEDTFAIMAFMGCLGFVGGLLSTLILDPLLSKNAEFQSLSKFIRNLPEHKKYTPICLHSSFEELYELYLDGKTFELRHEMKTMQKVIKQGLSDRFPAQRNNVMRAIKFLLLLPFFRGFVIVI